LSVYVDPLFTFGGDNSPRCFQHKPSCHMYADTLEELHELAQRIGLKRSWFQDDPRLQHYDLTKGKRFQALRHGAVEQTAAQMVAFSKEHHRRPADKEIECREKTSVTQTSPPSGSARHGSQDVTAAWFW